MGKKPDFENAYEQLQRISADDVKRTEYIRREKEIRDKVAYINYAKKAGREEWREGVARKLKKKGFPLEEIMEVSDLSMKKIMELKSQLE